VVSPQSVGKALDAHRLPGTSGQRCQHHAIARPQRHCGAAIVSLDAEWTQQQDARRTH
jgi:hypothetical protein